MILRTVRIKFIPTLFTIGMLFLFLSEGIAQNSSASSSKDSLTVGEVFNISLKLQLDKSYDRVIFPDSTAFPPVLDLIRTQKFRVTDFADSVLYQLQFFGNTDFTLPPLRIALLAAGDTSFIFTNSISLYFKTVLPSEDAELKPLKPIFSFSGFPWALTIIIIALIAAALLAYYTFKQKANKITEKEPPVFAPFRSPLAELVTTLKYLKDDYDLPVTKDYKYFYSALSDSIRTYYEELYDIPALESTSRELFRYLDAFGVDHEMIKQTRMILNRSDMVKFAKFTPTLDDAWTCHQYAIDFIERAKLVDASRISRKKSEYELQFKQQEQKSDLDTEIEKEDK
tara:strand:+ start:11639 stop:12661 length:1023 start_codon:yes stop_codon:yes gene_type:complete